MSTHTIVIPTRRPIMTANDQRRWHWTRVRDAKHAMQTEIWAHLKQAHIPTLTPPITVAATWYAPNHVRRDSDGLGPWMKAACDALVTANLIADDSWDYILGCSTAVRIDRDNPRIEIVLEETTP